jgi:hypothetical protein
MFARSTGRWFTSLTTRTVSVSGFSSTSRFPVIGTESPPRLMWRGIWLPALAPAGTSTMLSWIVSWATSALKSCPPSGMLSLKLTLRVGSGPLIPEIETAMAGVSCTMMLDWMMMSVGAVFPEGSKSRQASELGGDISMWQLRAHTSSTGTPVHARGRCPPSPG